MLPRNALLIECLNQDQEGRNTKSSITLERSVLGGSRWAYKTYGFDIINPKCLNKLNADS